MMKEFEKNLAKETIDAVKPAIVSFWKQKEFFNNSYECIGSGFLYERHGIKFCITALHVISDGVGVPRSRIFLLTMGGMTLLDTNFLTNRENDLAVFFLKSSYVSDFKLDYENLVFFKQPVGYLNFSNHLVFSGYPSTSSNKYTGGSINRWKLNIQSYHTSDSSSFDVSTEIKNPIFFDFNGKGLLSDKGESKRVEKLNGLSGGPVFRLCFTGDETNYTAKPLLVGMLVEWKSRNSVVAVDVGFINKFLDRIAELDS